MGFYAAALLLLSSITVYGDVKDEPQCPEVASPKTKYWDCYGQNEKRTCYRHAYYYNNSSNTCEYLGFQGCGGNNNNFLSRESCLSHCRTTPDSKNPDYERLKKYLPKCNETSNPPNVPGPVRRFFFNSTTKECHPVDVKFGDRYFPEMRICVDMCRAINRLPRCNEPKETGQSPTGWNCNVTDKISYTTCVKNVAAQK
uniref:Putative bpti/kunitz family of serine protease inhibitor n=1 Tax=Amblyomma americanum TaxID=6943 RepID=A0A0C9SFE6_AMBAM